jgi:sterol desaturase/sphingolipid hydroxylase (fatty acid hydroxylase superfamily)
VDLGPLNLSWSAPAMAAAFVAVALWEHARPDGPRSVAEGPRWRTNLALYAIYRAVAWAFAPPLAAALSAALSGAALLPTPATGLGTAAHAMAVLLALDLGYYLTHRALHAVPWLWRLHAVHHSDVDLDVTTSLRSHPAEPIPVALCLAVVGGILGAGMEEVAGYVALAFSIQLVAHANVHLPRPLQAMLRRIVVTPTYHRLHHSLSDGECQANFGTVLVLWDVLFGTARPPAARRPAAYGVAGYLEPSAQRLGALLVQPLRPQASRPGDGDAGLALKQ